MRKVLPPGGAIRAPRGLPGRVFGGKVRAPGPPATRKGVLAMATRRRVLVFSLILLGGCVAGAVEAHRVRLRWLPLGEAPATGVASAAPLSAPDDPGPTPGPAVATAAAVPARPAVPAVGTAPDSRPTAPAQKTGVPPAVASPGPAPAPAPARPLDLNLATAAQLEALPGIGPDLARRIIDYRRQYGDFRAVEELDRVRGIGPARLKKVAHLVRVGSAGGTR